MIRCSIASFFFGLLICVLPFKSYGNIEIANLKQDLELVARELGGVKNGSRIASAEKMLNCELTWNKLREVLNLKVVVLKVNSYKLILGSVLWKTEFPQTRKV